MAGPAPQAPMAAYRDPAGQAFLTQDSAQFPRDVLPKMIKLNPNQYRFLTILDRFGQLGRAGRGSATRAEAVKHPYEYEYYGERESAFYVTLTAAAAAGDATLTMSAADAQRLTNYQNLYATDTGERLRLKLADADAFPSATTVGVLRSVGDTPAQALAAGAKLFIGGASRTEKSVDPTATGYKPEKMSNYKGEYSKAFGATLLMMNSEQYAGWGPDADHKRTLDDFRREMEIELVMSEQEYLVASDGYPVTKTKGLYSAISSNVLTTTAVPDWWGFCDEIYPMLEHGAGGINGSKVKHLFCGPAWEKFFDKLLQDKYTINDPNSKMDYDDLDKGLKWGWQIRTLTINSVTLHIHPMPWWKKVDGAALNLAQTLMVVDANHIGIRYGVGGRPALLPKRGPGGRAPNNVTYELECIRADFGLQYDYEASHGRWTCTAL